MPQDAWFYAVIFTLHKGLIRGVLIICTKLVIMLAHGAIRGVTCTQNYFNKIILCNRNGCTIGLLFMPTNPIAFIEITLFLYFAFSSSHLLL